MGHQPETEIEPSGPTLGRRIREADAIGSDAADSELTGVLERLERWGAARDWIGPDPYEGLNTPLGRLARGRRGRQFAVQAYKRSPVRPPWPLTVTPRPNSKTLALVLSGYATERGSQLPGAERYLSDLPARLDAMNVVPDGAGWGYHFDLQTRSLHYSGARANAIATVFVVEALLDTYEWTGSTRCAELAVASRRFLLSLLSAEGTVGPKGERYFMYVTDGSRLVHNANVLVCGALARIDELDPSVQSGERAAEALQASLSAQRADGLWPYGDAPNLQWADSFHTAYVLEGLSRAAPWLGFGSEQLDIGLAAWREHFFNERHEAFYYAGRRFPLEAHCYASAVDLLCTLGDPPDDAHQLARLIASAAIRDLWLPAEGRFGFKRTRLGLNRRAFVRWTNAPMFRALARLSSLRT